MSDPLSCINFGLGSFRLHALLNPIENSNKQPGTFTLPYKSFEAFLNMKPHVFNTSLKPLTLASDKICIITGQKFQ
jgi:hypothetical protein